MTATTAPLRTAALFGRFEDERAVGDVIPFYAEGAYHLFCLTPPAGTLHFPERLCTTWRHLRSTDLLTWEELPPAIEPGPAGSYDSGGIWTGSAIQVERRTHLFYTAHMPEGELRQTICHAESTDLVTFTKDPDNPIITPDLERFESRDWRDPFVFFNEAEGVYWMVISARLREVPAAQRGVLAVATSVDLRTWTPFEPLIQTMLTHCPECPEMYQRGDHWVLAYSRFSDRRRTVYRVASTPRGPWRTTTPEGPDAAHWYAAKSLVDDTGRQLAFGWIPDREEHDHRPSWLWGGDLALPREVRTTADGELKFTPAQEVQEAFCAPLELLSGSQVGAWQGMNVAALGASAHALLEPVLDDSVLAWRLTADVETRNVKGFVGIAFNTTDQLDRGLAIFIYPQEHTVRAVDLAAPCSEVEAEYETMNDQYLPVAEHHLPNSRTGKSRIEAYLRGDLVEVFVDERVCLTYRLASAEGGKIALIVQDGEVAFTELKAETLG